MALRVGIVGLPNVGKSTLFNALTKSKVEAANYPFATIDPNISDTKIEDKRLIHLASKFNSKKTLFAYLSFVDIAGLVKGASKGEGLGNKFLSNIRETDAIVHLVRCFESNDITHVSGKIDPISDIEVIEMELVLADIQNIENIISKNSKKLSMSKVKRDNDLLKILELVLIHLKSNKKIISYKINDYERELLNTYNFLTNKKIIYVANVDENTYANNLDNEYTEKVSEYAASNNSEYLSICAKTEEELIDLSESEREEFLSELGVKNSGLQQLISSVYKLLDQLTFFTAGPQEARAWEFTKGMSAPNCAGKIHSDFEKGFIKAEIYNYEDFNKFEDEKIIKEKGLIRSEGKTYLVKDGDICLFRFNN